MKTMVSRVKEGGMMALGALMLGFAGGLAVWAMVENNPFLLWIIFPMQITGLILMHGADNCLAYRTVQRKDTQ